MTEPDFAREALKLAEKLFPADDILVETMRVDNETLPDVKVTHTPSGTVVVCNRFPSQIKNKLAALLELRVLVDNQRG